MKTFKQLKQRELEEESKEKLQYMITDKRKMCRNGHYKRRQRRFANDTFNTFIQSFT